MTRAHVLAVLGLLWAAPAEAHCYSIWHYRSPQRCSARSPSGLLALRSAPARAAPGKQLPAPVAPLPPYHPKGDTPLDEAAQRAVALDALRHALNAMELIR